MKRLKMELSIRPMTETDALPVSTIVVADYRLLAQREGFSREQLDRLLAERSTETIVREGWLRQWDCHVAESGGDVLGALAIEGNDVAELWICPEHQREGIGTALFRHAEHSIRKAGHRTLTLRCAARGAAPFYEAMGMQVVDTLLCPDGPLEGWLLTHYIKDLGEPEGQPADAEAGAKFKFDLFRGM
jgi:GNAT superfamily N-acetyltransferase